MSEGGRTSRIVGFFPTGVGGVGHGAEPTPLPGRLSRRDMDGLELHRRC